MQNVCYPVLPVRILVLSNIHFQLDPNNSGWAVYGDVVYELATMLLQLVTQNTAQVSGHVWL